METQKGPYKDYSPLKGGYMSFHVSLGECTQIWGLIKQEVSHYFIHYRIACDYVWQISDVFHL